VLLEERLEFLRKRARRPLRRRIACMWLQYEDRERRQLLTVFAVGRGSLRRVGPMLLRRSVQGRHPVGHRERQPVGARMALVGPRAASPGRSNAPFAGRSKDGSGRCNDGFRSVQGSLWVGPRAASPGRSKGGFGRSKTASPGGSKTGTRSGPRWILVGPKVSSLIGPRAVAGRSKISSMVGQRCE
jgi:hypothetical protein